MLLLPLVEISQPQQNPCIPSPCGHNSHCRVANGVASCSCLPEMKGSPPSCRPECIINSECPSNKACINRKCQDPCPGSCGYRASCDVVNHNPLCSCPAGYTGSPFSECQSIISIVSTNVTPKQHTNELTISIVPPSQDVIPQNPCIPSPCGPYSQCESHTGIASCKCLPDYLGNAPYCRPECIANSECSPSTACINEKCRDPCPGLCGHNAVCRTVNHIPQCACVTGYMGDPFTNCVEKPRPQIPVRKPSDYPTSQAYPTSTRQPIVTSTPQVPDYVQAQTYPPPTVRPEPQGDPPLYVETVTTSPAPQFRPTQSQQPEYIPTYHEHISPCEPNPCGYNAECRAQNNAGSCVCLANFYGNPYEGCRPECIINSDCPASKACIQTKCRDPCPGTCGQNALCHVVNHLASCTCITGYSGDPFRICHLEIQSKISFILPLSHSLILRFFFFY